MFLFIIFFLPIILFFFGILYMLSGKSDSPKSNSSRGNYYYYDDYDDSDYDEYGYYCPECDADLYDDDCEHRDDWI